MEAPKNWQTVHEPKVGLPTTGVNRTTVGRPGGMRPPLLSASEPG